jgi:regulator of RNase E activity RraA
MSEPPAEELCERYSATYTGLLTDVLEARGLEDQTLDHRIEPLVPTMTTAGIAFPVVGRPNRSIDGDANLERITTMLSEVPANRIVIYDTNGSQCAHIGELSVTALEVAGCRGAVIDGGARDTPHLQEQEFPVFLRHSTPEGANIRWEILDWDVPTVAGGVQVSPGDVVVGDRDGVVVVPAALAEDVLRDAESLMAQEDTIREAVRNGVRPVDAFREHGSF